MTGSSIGLSPLYPNSTIDLHVKIATSLHQSFQDLQLLQEWQRQYCGGVQQRFVRDISKYDAGTVPLVASAEETNPAEVAWNTMRFEGEQAEEENQPLVGVEEDSSTPVLFKKGEFLAVKPGFKINECYSRILNSINKRTPTAFATAEVIESELKDDYLTTSFWIVSSMVLTGS